LLGPPLAAVEARSLRQAVEGLGGTTERCTLRRRSPRRRTHARRGKPLKVSAPARERKEKRVAVPLADPALGKSRDVASLQ
jgi:hypothetical protein